MCVVSAVHDHYDRIIPQPVDVPPFPWQIQPPGFLPTGTVTFTTALTSAELAEMRALEASLRKLIADFREAVAAAKVVDRLTGQPDCVDPVGYSGTGPVCTVPPGHDGDHVATDPATGSIVDVWRNG